MPATPTRSVTLSTYLEPDEAEIVRARARAADRSVAAELRRLLRPYLLNDLDPGGEPGPRENSPVVRRYDGG